MNESKKEKKNNKIDGIKMQKDLNDVPELCLRCKYRTKDKYGSYCEEKESEHLQPSIVCFIPLNAEKASNCDDVLALLDYRALNDFYYEVVRNVLKVLRKIRKWVNENTKMHIKVLSGFKEFLERENLEFNEKYYKNVVYE